MNAAELFQKIEKIIPLDIALEGDKVGFIGSETPDDIQVKNVLVLMDYIPSCELKFLSNNLNNSKISNLKINYEDYDLLITHHPPIIKPEIPTYVIHSNWDLITPGACDSLAETLEIKVLDVLDPKTGLGRLGNPLNGPISLEELEALVMEKLNIDCIKSVKTSKFLNNPQMKINKVAVVSGFGLNANFIKIAHNRGAEVYISGDLTHTGAIMAKALGINLIDVNHHASEIPGLYDLARLIKDLGIEVEVFNTGIPWDTKFKFISDK
ncbi:MAG: Nif3-like dinuclear metal center hexameric protein [Methanobacteriaceae archaeon]|nr:Nif3-like dinuclear metal center hexameric protein [Methanobacteriaceae archaeon]MDP2837367.1 Nif3-like dinuclear metal center hexameric protein [Methanobacteriaceae archaeon]MDP3035553.1 Nif3-like dinuclear metal center hexameric protein [Methanobacteriaceae archaeon]MDP3485770.1 Nif3-like dinuclear metal center hexameric protein [Methanobacteriaceae archaeon]MDP3624225.1 Nif3-like dinuclear metal center hexameric protein [Methanobacteriaceae archaeon]